MTKIDQTLSTIIKTIYFELSLPIFPPDFALSGLTFYGWTFNSALLVIGYKSDKEEAKAKREKGRGEKVRSKRTKGRKEELTNHQQFQFKLLVTLLNPQPNESSKGNQDTFWKRATCKAATTSTQSLSEKTRQRKAVLIMTQPKALYLHNVLNFQPLQSQAHS